MGLTDLPPELMLYLSTFLRPSSLGALIPTSKKYAYLLTKQLYDMTLFSATLDGPDYGPSGRKLKDPWESALEWKSSLIVMYFSNVSLWRGFNNGMTWVHFFAYAGNQQLLELMISRGLPFDDYGGGSTPLSLATSRMHTGIIHLLIRLGADIHKGFKNRSRMMSSFERAFRTERVEIVEPFIETLGDVNADIPTITSGQGYVKALHLAAEVGSGSITEFLLARGADPFAYCYYGGRFNVSRQRWQTALHLACRHGRFGPCPALVNSMKAIKGGNGSLSPLDSSGDTPLHAAIEGTPGRADWRSDSPAIIRLLIESGADLSSWNLRGQTLMDVTIISEHRELAVGLLKEHGPWRNGVWEIYRDPEDYYGYFAELFSL